MARLLRPYIIVSFILTDDLVENQDIEGDFVQHEDSEEKSTLEDVCSKIPFIRNYKLLWLSNLFLGGHFFQEKILRQ